jgi:transposase InsO family protein
MIHSDTKQLACFERIGHRITRDRCQGCSRRVGDGKVHIALNNASPLATVEVLPDEQKATTIVFLNKAAGWFNEQGISRRRILSDNGLAYCSGDWRRVCNVLDLKPIRTKPTTPLTNGKAERYIQILCREWAYGMPFQPSDERNKWLAASVSVAR